MNLNEMERLFNFEKYSLNTRALNILSKLNIDEFAPFVQFLFLMDANSELNKISNCGEITRIELLAFFNDFKKKIQYHSKLGNIDIHIEKVSAVEKTKSIYSELKFTEALKLIRRNKNKKNTILDNLLLEPEFQTQYKKLSKRANNILENSGINNLPSFYTALFNPENELNFSEIKFCGKKTEQELQDFLIYVVTNILKIHNTESEIADYKTDKNKIFFLLDHYIFHLNKFNKRDQDLLQYNYKIGALGSLSKQEALEHFLIKFNLSKERIRQIIERLPNKLNTLSKEIIKQFNIEIAGYFQGKFFFIDEMYVKTINENEKSAFSSLFIDHILSIIKDDFYYHYSINNPHCPGLFISKSISFDFNSIFIQLDDIINKKRYEDHRININADAINQYECDLIKEIIEKYLIFAFGIELKFDKENNLIIARNTVVRLREYLIEILRAERKPLHYSVLFNKCIEKEVGVSSALSVHSQMQRFPEIFGLKGAGIYGLKEWGGYFGSIGDISHQYLIKKNRRVRFKELEKFVCSQLICSKDSIPEVLFRYNGESRFIKYNNGYVGLKIWEDKQLQLFPE